MTITDEQKYDELSELIGLLKAHGEEIASAGYLWMSVREVIECATKLRDAYRPAITAGSVAPAAAQSTAPPASAARPPTRR